VLDVTGMTFTPRNMLALHDRINTLQNNLSRIERQLQSARTSNALDATAHINLASAYRRLQANGALPATARVRPTLDLQVRVPPVMLAPLPEEPPPPPPPMSPDPIYVPSTPPAPPPVRVVARPPPTGDVFVYVVRD
jgi:hypothetical protein